MKENKLLIVKLVKRNGRLQFKNAADLSTFKALVDQMKEGEILEQLTDFSHQDGMLSQIAKIHAMIKDIAKETGDTVQNTKIWTKKNAGLVTLNGELKSFGDASFQELSDVIQMLIETGDLINLNLR